MSYWWLARQAREAVDRARAAIPKPVLPPQHAASAGADAIPVRDLPGLGPLLARDPSGAELEALIDRLRRLGFGIISDTAFRSFLDRLGLPDAHTIPDSELATTVLSKLAEFQPLLEAWQAAVAAGRWDNSQDTTVGLCLHPEQRLADAIAGLLNLKAKAQWATGDAAGAWATVQWLALTAQRSLDATRPWGGTTTGPLHAVLSEGLASGALSDDQLREIPSLVAGLDPLGRFPAFVEASPSLRSEEIRFSDAHREQGGTSQLHWDWENPLGSMASNLRTLRDTPRQQAGTFELFSAMEQASAASIDYGTRTVLSADQRAALDPTKHIGSDWFSQFYYGPALMYAEMTPGLVWASVRLQVGLDHAGIAAQLELAKRTTGHYPATLPAGVPHDPATGAPYGYRLTPDGSYTLWSSGENQVDNGGNQASDFVWPRHPRVP